METKKCSKCGQIKDVCLFSKNNKTKDKLSCSCKDCDKQKYNENRERNILRMRKYKKNNPDIIKKYYSQNKEKYKQYRESKKESTKLYMKDYYHNNLEKRKEYIEKNSDLLKEKRKEYYKNNKEKLNQYNKDYRKKNIEKEIVRWKVYYETNKESLIKKSVEYSLLKRKTCHFDRLKHNVRNRISFYLKINNFSKNNKTFEIVGCSPESLKEHIQSQFTDGMSWENYGYDGWHIDHRIPLSSAKNEQELYKLCHFTNLQPMWATENIKKGNKII